MNFFAYGTLMNRTYLKTVCGKNFKFKKAVLNHYQKYASESGYPYVVEKENTKVEGVVYYDVDKESFEKIDKYECEGDLYIRRKVEVALEDGKELEAYVYIGNIYNLRRTFGDRINVKIVQRVEEFIENKVGERIEMLYHPGVINNSQKIELLAKKELLGAEIKEVSNMYFNDEYVSNYAIDNELQFQGLPELPAQEGMPEKIYKNYIQFIFHTMVLNQLEDHITKNFKNLIYYSYPLYEKTLSLLTALKFLNTRLYDLLIYFENIYDRKKIKTISYMDLTKECVMIAGELFAAHSEELQMIAMEVRRKLNPGELSLGVELEFSNLGYQTLKKNTYAEKDKSFHAFKYFSEFDLLRRLWKLGGHIDDHTISEQEEKKIGFLEFAIGRESIYNTHSSPLTRSLFVCHSFISELIVFTNIKPHSIHINIQNPQAIDWNKENNIELLKCLILLAGDFRKTKQGKIVERRIYNREIIKDSNGYLRLICENHHMINNNKETSVIEYQFPRLSMTKNYESVIGAFKGFQIAYNPRPFGSKVRLVNSKVIKKESYHLEKWALDVKPVSKVTIHAFLSYVEQGFYTEVKGHPAHKSKYIEDLLFQIEKELKSVNESISDPLRFIRKNQNIPYEKLARKFLVS